MKNKTLKYRIITGMLVGTMLLAAVVTGCGKKRASDNETSSNIESLTETKETETLPANEKSETETDDEGNVKVITTTYETNADGETVTDAEGKNIIAETKTEKFTKDEWESKETATKTASNNKNNNSSKNEGTTSSKSDSQKETKVATVTPTQSQTKANTTKPTQAATKPTQAPTQAPAKPITKPTQAPKPTQTPKPSIPSKWSKTTMVDYNGVTYNFYTNGEWMFEYTLDPLDGLEWNMEDEYSVTTYNYRWFSKDVLGKTPKEGILLVKYVGNKTDIRIPEQIDGISVIGLDFEIRNDNVKSVTYPASIDSFGSYSYSNVQKIVIEPGSHMFETSGVGADAVSSKVGLVIYCDEATYNLFTRNMDNSDSVVFKSLDGKTTFRDKHSDLDPNPELHNPTI